MNRDAAETANVTPGATLSGSESENMDLLARFYEQEDSSVSAVQASIERISRVFGSSTYLAFAVLFILAWVTF